MLRLSLLWSGCPQGEREEETVEEPPCSCFLSSARLIQIGAGRTGSGGPCQLPVPPSPPQQPRQGGAYHSLHVVNCHCSVFRAGGCKSSEWSDVGKSAGQRQRGAGHPRVAKEIRSCKC